MNQTRCSYVNGYHCKYYNRGACEYIAYCNYQRYDNKYDENKRLKELETENEKLIERIKELETENEKLIERIKELQAEYEKFKIEAEQARASRDMWAEIHTSKE